MDVAARHEELVADLAGRHPRHAEDEVAGRRRAAGTRRRHRRRGRPTRGHHRKGDSRPRKDRPGRESASCNGRWPFRHVARAKSIAQATGSNSFLQIHILTSYLGRSALSVALLRSMELPSTRRSSTFFRCADSLEFAWRSWATSCRGSRGYTLRCVCVPVGFRTWFGGLRALTPEELLIFRTSAVCWKRPGGTGRTALRAR